MSDFIDNLAISEEERRKLRSLGVKSPFGILSMRKASRDAFDSHIGPERADAIAEQLKSLLTADELARLSEPAQKGGSLGARLPPRPKPKI